MNPKSDQRTNLTPGSLAESHIQTVEEYQALVFEHRRTNEFNPSLLDWRIDYAYDQYRNFKVWSLDGKHLSVCSFLKDKKARLVFWGNYVTAPQFRYQGLSYPVFKAEYDRLVAKGYCVVASTPFAYTTTCVLKLGMQVAGRVQTYNLRPAELQPSPLVDQVAAGTPEDLPDILAYDFLVSKRQREAVWKVFLSDSSISVLVYREGGRVVGVGVLIPGISDYQLGPLYADSPEIAHAVIAAAANRIQPTHRIVLDSMSPVQGQSKVPFLKSLGLRPTVEFEVVSSSVLPHDIQKTFAIFHYDMGI